MCAVVRYYVLRSCDRFWLRVIVMNAISSLCALAPVWFAQAVRAEIDQEPARHTITIEYPVRREKGATNRKFCTPVIAENRAGNN